MRFFWILCLWFFTFAQAANLQDVVPLKKWQGEEWVNSETTKFSADARFAAGLDHGTVIVIDLEKRKKVFRVGEMTQEVNSQLSDTIQWFGFSPKKATEHEWFVVQSYSRLRAWDWETKSLIFESIANRKYPYLGGLVFLEEFIVAQRCANNDHIGCHIYLISHDGKEEEWENGINFGVLYEQQSYMAGNKFILGIGLDEKSFNIHNYTDSNGDFEVFDGFAKKIIALSIFPNKSKIASLDTYGSVKIWDINMQKKFVELQDPKTDKKRAHYIAESLSFSPDGKYLFTTSKSETRVWDWQNNILLKTMKFGSLPIFSSDGKVMIHAEAENIVFLRLNDFQEIKRLKSHLRRVYPKAISEDGKRLASMSLDGTLKIWDLTKNLPVQTFGLYKYSVVSDMGNVIGVARGDGIMQFSETFSGKLLSKISIGSEYGEKKLVLSPDGQYLAYGEITYNHGINDRWVSSTRLRVWNTNTGQLLWKKMNVPSGEIIFQTSGKNFTTSGKILDNDIKITNFNTQTGRELFLRMIDMQSIKNVKLKTPEFKFLHYEKNVPKVIITDTLNSKIGDYSYLYNLRTKEIEQKFDVKTFCQITSQNNLYRRLTCTHNPNQYFEFKIATDKWIFSPENIWEESSSGRTQVFDRVLVRVKKNSLKITFISLLPLDLFDTQFPTPPTLLRFSADNRFLFHHGNGSIQMYGTPNFDPVF